MRELFCTKQLEDDILTQWENAGIKLQLVPLIQTFPLPFYVDIEFSPMIWVFTSPRAVDSLQVLLKSYFLPILRQKKIVAIGQKTTDKLGALGFPVATKANNALALAEEIHAHFFPQPILHFCGNKRRDELSDRLTELNFQVIEKVVYQTKLSPQHIPWKQEEGAIFFSPSAVESYFQINTWPSAKVAFAIGPTTAEALHKAGVERIGVADKPHPDALLKLILTAKKYV